ncbi:unnamed protein product, partial [Urochloa humidicola]
GVDPAKLVGSHGDRALHRRESPPAAAATALVVSLLFADFGSWVRFDASVAAGAGLESYGSGICGLHRQLRVVRRRRDLPLQPLQPMEAKVSSFGEIVEERLLPNRRKTSAEGESCLSQSCYQILC